MQHHSDNIGGNMVEQNMTTDELAPQKPNFTMHSLFLVLMITFVFSLAFVLGLTYFFDLSSLQGQALQSFCPSFTGNLQPQALCLNG